MPLPYPPAAPGDYIGAAWLDTIASNLRYWVLREVAAPRMPQIQAPYQPIPPYGGGAFNNQGVNWNGWLRHYGRYLNIGFKVWGIQGKAPTGNGYIYVTPWVGNGPGTRIQIVTFPFGSFNTSQGAVFKDYTVSNFDLTPIVASLPYEGLYFVSFGADAWGGTMVLPYDVYETTGAPAPAFLTGTTSTTFTSGTPTAAQWKMLSDAIYNPISGGNLGDTLITPYGTLDSNCLYAQSLHPTPGVWGNRWSTSAAGWSFLTHWERYLRILASVDFNSRLEIFAQNIPASSGGMAEGADTLIFALDMGMGPPPRGIVYPDATVIPSGAVTWETDGGAIVDYKLDLHQGDSTRYTPRSFGAFVPAFGQRYALRANATRGTGKVMALYETGDLSGDPAQILAGYTNPPTWTAITDALAGTSGTGSSKNVATLRADLAALFGGRLQWKNYACMRYPWPTYTDGNLGDNPQYRNVGGYLLARAARWLHYIAPDTVKLKLSNTPKFRYWSSQADLGNGKLGWGWKEQSLPNTSYTANMWQHFDLDSIDCPEGTEIQVFMCYGVINDHNV